MNYFDHHIGDYDEATAHLTACEDGIYSRLIRKYMATEKPLPADIKTLQRLVRARAKDEKEAVQTILDEFFELREDGWHQHRCDETIARYLDKQRKARASAEARWGAQKSQSDGNANAYPDAMRTHSEGNAHQSPVTNNQTPEKEKTKRVTALSCSDLMADGLTEETANEWLAFRRQKRAPLTASAWEGIKREAAKAGWVMQDVVTKCMARGWQGFEADWVKSGRSPTTKQAEWDASIDEFLGDTKQADPYTIEAEYARIR